MEPNTQPVGIHIDFAPTTGSPEEWNDAYARLADFYRAHRIHHRVHRTGIILETLRRAAVTHARHPAVSPMEVTIHEARKMQRAWLREIMGDLNVPESKLDARGRMAFLLCDGPNKYPAHFLAAGNAPPDMVEAMRKPIEQSGPDLAFSSMVPRSIDLGPVTDFAEDASDFLGRHAWLRYFSLSVFTVLVLWGLYTVTR